MILDVNGQQIQQENDMLAAANAVDMDNINKQPSLKIPIFVGVNDKDKLDQVLEIVKDDGTYEVAILSATRYKELLVEYQFSKMTKEQQDSFDKFKQDQEAKAKFHQLAMDLHECGYKSFDRDQLKQFMRLERKRALTNKQADDLIDCLFAFKEIEMINASDKIHERNYMLLTTIEDQIEALELKQSVIKNEIDILNTEKVEVGFQILKLKNAPTQTQETIESINDNTANLSGISDDFGQKSD